MTGKHLGDPDEYLKRLMLRTFKYMITENNDWVEASTKAANETAAEIGEDFKKDIIDGLIDMLFGK